MATYYVSSLLGNAAYDGTQPTFLGGNVGPKATLTQAEDIPVAAGDTVWVQGGSLCVYREMVTLDVSGNAGNPITYCADVLGQIPGWQDSVGMARVTGSDDDQTATRANCITGTTRSYRTFRGFMFDTCSSYLLNGGADTQTNWIIEDCTFQNAVGFARMIEVNGANQSNWQIRHCLFWLLHSSGHGINFAAAVTIDDCNHIVENCIFISGLRHVQVNRVGGVVVRNCISIGAQQRGYYLETAVAAGQTFSVYGCVMVGCSTALYAIAADGTFIEDYNDLYGNGTPRTNVAVGANSNIYPPLFDLGILHSGAGQVSGFRLPQPQLGTLSNWSQIRAIADGGTNATLDLTGLTRPPTDGKRSWGAVQYQNVGREATTVHGGSLALRFDDYGRRQFKVPCTNVATTVSVYCYREADYAGTNPTMIIKQPGVADRVTTDAGAAGGWNLLTDTFTPAASPGWFVVELCSLNTDEANAATNDCFFDDLTVSVNSSLGTMETWLWDTEVSDWVAYAGGGACDYPAEGDVEAGVVYGSGAYTGTLVCGKRCARFPDMELCKRRGTP